MKHLGRMSVMALLGDECLIIKTMLEDVLKRRELQERILHSSEVVSFSLDLPPVVGNRKLEINLFSRSNG